MAIACGLIIIVAKYACRQIKLVPDTDQNMWEVVIEWLLSLCEPILGEKGAKRTFWFFAAIFIFIVSANLLALVPGTGSLGYQVATDPQALNEVNPLNLGFHYVYHPSHGDHEAHGIPGIVGYTAFLRGSNADTNMVFAMSIWFMVFWLYWSISELGFVGFLHHIFGPKASVGGKGFFGWLIAAFFVAIFLAVGVIEVISIAFRPISLAFRLFGNIYGGEAMLESIFEAPPYWIISVLALIPAYLFELLVAVVQALVFCLLAAAFTGTMIKHDDHHGHDEAHGGAEATTSH